MARKRFDLGIDGDAPARPPRKKEFDNPLEQTPTGRRKAARVTGLNTDAAGRVRKTIFLDPTTINEIEDIVSEAGYSKMDFYEWLILVGMQQFDRGIRPEVEGRPVTKTRIKIER